MIWVTLKQTNKYEVNINGEVRNKRTKRFTKSNPDKDGYLKVVLYHDEKRRNYFVHRLIAEAFILNPENKPVVNHIDGNVKNNTLSNLEWATIKENVNHAYKMGLCKGRPGNKHHNVKLTENDILEIKKLVKQKIPRKIIAKMFNIHKNHIYRLIVGSRWKHLEKK